MTRYLKALLVALVPFGVLAFTRLDVNPIHWTQGARFLAAVVGLVAFWVALDPADADDDDEAGA